MSGPGLLRTALGLVCAAGLFGVGVQAWGPAQVRAPGLVVPALEFRVEHDGAGAVRWVVLDGSVPGGPVVTSEGVLLADRLSPLEVSLADGLEQGASVSAGQTLASLSLRAVRGEAAGVRDAAESTRADFDRLAEQGRAAEVRAAAANVQLAEASLARARRAAGVARSLVERGAAGEWEAELADLDVGVQEGALAAAKAELTRAQGMNLRAEVDAVALGRDAADAAALDATLAALDPGLQAPFSGTLRRLPAPGLVAVAADGPGLVQVALPERDAGRIRLGAPVAFHGNAGGDGVPGTVLAVSEAAAIGPSGPAVWALVQLDAPVAAGSTGVARVEAEAW